MDNYNPFSLLSKTILITGASSGIGKSISIECSKMGAVVIITGRNKERLSETYESLVGDNHLMIQADLTNIEDRVSLVDNLPKLSGVVHCAGISKITLCKEVTDEEVEQIMKINFQSPIMLQKQLISRKRIEKEASIVFISSRTVESPTIGNAIYSASKASLLSYAKVLGLELAPRKIRVNSILPGMVWTNLITSDSRISMEDLENAQLEYPLKRFGIPEDIAYLVIYLLSNASSWMTGSCIDISGGGEGVLK